MNRTRIARTAVAALALLAVPFAGACADEDGDGATTDEEIQDLKDGAKKAEDRIQTEIDGQKKESNDGG